MRSASAIIREPELSSPARWRFGWISSASSVAAVDKMPTELSSGPLTLFQFISLGLLIALGSAANSLVMFGFGKYLRLRRSPYTLMVGFVSLDMLRVLLCFPVVFVTVVHRIHWKYGSEMCEALAFVNAFCLTANCLGIFGMALDRYVDNQHRSLYRRRFGRASLGIAMLLVVWGTAVLLVGPTTYDRQGALLGIQCTYPRHFHSSRVDTLGLMASLVTVILLTNVVYLRLYLFLRARRKMRPVLYEPAVSENWGFYDPRSELSVRRRWLADSLSDTPIAVVSRNAFQSHALPTNYEVALWRSRRQKDKEKLTKLCFVTHVIFSAMWLPYIVVGLWFAMQHDTERVQVPEWLEGSVTWLTYTQVTVTPLAFFSLSGISRRKFRILNGTRRFSPTLSDSSA